MIANEGQKDSELRGFRDLGSASYSMEFCFNRSETILRSGWKHVISMEFLHSFLRRNFAGKTVVASRNVGCFLTIPTGMLIFVILIKRKVLIVFNDMILILIPAAI